MIVDTSALVAVLLGEEGRGAILDALEAEEALLPAPALAEFLRVTSGSRIDAAGQAATLLEEWKQGGLRVLPFTEDHAMQLERAIPLFGKGNGRGGTLNLLDLMVYAVAMENGEALLCTGADFATTDVELHPASRVG